MTHRTRTSFIGATLLAAGGLGSACGKPDIPRSCDRDEMALVTFRETDYNVPMCADVHAASRRDATATSAGVDESFATSRPGAIPWTNLTFNGALEACARAGKYLCDVRTYRVIGPSVLDPATPPERPISALEPTSDVTELPDQKEPLFPPAVSAIPFPESAGSIAFWAFSRDDDDWSEYSETTHLIFGRLTTTTATSSVSSVAMFDNGFRHPLLGFRCCIDPRIDGAFEPLPPDPDLVRTDLEPVPIASPVVGDAGAGGGDGG
ncbi:MAG: hypothetical protein FJ104_07130 [Deltaproteobacteria bacterium]|nr:hypothetical protein [Deltaproteobacteria bacterium]